MEQQPPSNRRQRQTEAQPQQSPAPQHQSDNDLPPGTRKVPYPHGEGYMIVKDNFKKPVASYN